ncbi:MAG: hypothetical protein R3B13_20285 [Polyangiaceae bacterium]
MQGLTREMRPLMRMTVPRGLHTLSPETVTLGAPLMRSWVLLFGVLPIDRSDLTLVELEPGRRFLERSPMLSMRLWQHERVIEPRGDGCTLTDRLTFEPRFATPLVMRIVRAFFRHRHQVLRRVHGGPAPARANTE